ncbi:MAG TPA: glutathione S-transferase N-terminal domain-containing protein [Steroidobacteraceae bacterium]|nr:glutathione S-transferase N-terminal domain-containing protein [Steroidobacteraceae bacterium]
MSDAKLRLYELVFDNGRSPSPFVWRIRYALGRKGLPFESVPMGYMEMSAVLGDRFKTVPVVGHGETMLNESWDIAQYLDREFPDRPAIFSSPAEYAAARLHDEWFAAVIMRKLSKIYTLDIYNSVRAADRAYYRKSREARFGATLEEFTAGREALLPTVRQDLAPLRAQLARFPFLGGDAANYIDYIVLGAFQWVASVSTLPLLAHDDSLRDWLNRGFDLYGGIGRDPRMRPLFDQSA